MHVHAYKLKLQPTLWDPPALTVESLAERLDEDAVVHELAPYAAGTRRSRGLVAVVSLREDRGSHEEALNELLVAVQELGYSFVEAEITRVADRAIEMAVGFGVGGLGAGTATENAELAVIGAAIGWVVGLFVGANMQKAEVLYEVRWTNQGWHLTPVEKQPSAPAWARPALGTAYTRN